MQMTGVIGGPVGARQTVPPRIPVKLASAGLTLIQQACVDLRTLTVSFNASSKQNAYARRMRMCSYPSVDSLSSRRVETILACHESA